MNLCVANPPLPCKPLQGYPPPYASHPADRGSLLEAVLLDLFTGILLALEPSRHSTAPRPGLARSRVAVFWSHPGCVVLLQADLFTPWTSDRTLQIGDIIRRDGDQLPAALSPIAQKIEIVRSPVMLISVFPLHCWPPVLATQRHLVRRAAGNNSSYFTKTRVPALIEARIWA